MYKYNNLNYESEALINLLSLKSIDIEKEYGMLYLNKLNSPIRAFAIQCLLIGIVSMSFGLFTIVFEKEKWSILKQWILYFIFTTIVWIPISIFCWGYYNLPTTITVTLSYLIGYAITAFIQYKNCKESVDKINERLKELKEEGE